jgi:predicted dehydrogenase
MASSTQRKITYVVVGAGNRGSVYALYAKENPSLAQIMGVADPSEYRRRAFLKAHQAQNIPAENVFSDWKELAQREKIADCVVIATPDSLHVEPAIAFANKGYHILIEKPMAVTAEDCRKIVKATKENNVILAVGHVMRYTPYTQKIKELVSSGVLGDVINVQHLEPVGFWHFAHSYVRGNWRNEATSTFSLMAKSCHDIDWIRYIMGEKCAKVSSFGSLKHFVKKNKPKEAGDATRCVECPIGDTCTYSAKKFYLERVKQGQTQWPVSVIVTREPDIEAVMDALREGPYGRCAYECDNDVCDNQVVNMEFESGKTASFTMIAYSKDQCTRKTRIYGTQGELDCDGHRISHTDFGTMTTTVYQPPAKTDTQMTGHDGADWYLMDCFVRAVATLDPSHILSGPEETLESHLVVFAAENARRTNQVISTVGITTSTTDNLSLSSTAS